jgi:hypothetical protein
VQVGDLVKILTVDDCSVGIVVTAWCFTNGLENIYDVWLESPTRKPPWSDNSSPFLASQLEIISKSQ